MKKADFIFTEDRLDFQTAKNRNPYGYRIPSRLELLKGFEEGVFDGELGYVWSHTSSDDGKRFVMNLATGHIAEEYDFKSKKVIFIRQEWGESRWF